MRVCVINLAKDKARMSAVDAQLKRIGVEYERIEAVYAKELPQEVINNAVNKFRWWCAIGRPVRVGEIGCAMSHYKIYDGMTTDVICVLEDDVILSDEFKAILAKVESWIDPGKPQVVLLSNHTRTSGAGIVHCKQDKYTEGYVITRKAAKTLMKANQPMQVPCDHWGRWTRLGIIELYHAFPTVCSQDQSQYESGTVDKGCFDVSRLCLMGFVVHKIKRAIGLSIDRLLLAVDRRRKYNT